MSSTALLFWFMEWFAAQIAEELCISEETVKTHTKHIYGKLDVHSLRSLVVLVETGTSFDEDGAS